MFFVATENMAGLAALQTPALEQGAFSVITLVSGLVAKVPVDLSNIGSGNIATFHINRQVVRGDVPLSLQDLAVQVGPFWYSHSDSQIVETIDKRAFHVVKSGMVDDVEVTIDDYACIQTDRFIEGPEFQLFVNGNGCTGKESIPAKELGAWIRIGPSGVEEVALPMSTSFSLLLMLNLASLAFYLLISVSAFKPDSDERLSKLGGYGVFKGLSSACATAIVYVSCFDIVFDTQCSMAEAAAAGTGLTVFFLIVGKAITESSNISSSAIYTIDRWIVLCSSVSLSFSVSAIDYLTSEETFSLVSFLVNGIASAILLLVILRSDIKYILAPERCIVELAIVSALRTLVSAELGVFFALGVAFTSSILIFKF